MPFRIHILPNNTEQTSVRNRFVQKAAHLSMKHRFVSATDVRLPNICLFPKHIFVYFVGPSREDGMRHCTITDLSVIATSQIFATGALEALYQSAGCSSKARGAVGGDLGEV